MNKTTLPETWAQPGTITLDAKGNPVPIVWQKEGKGKQQYGLRHPNENKTVDAIILRTGANNITEMLAIFNERLQKWAFPGGFYERSDLAVRSAKTEAIREVFEETLPALHAEETETRRRIKTLIWDHLEEILELQGTTFVDDPRNQQDRYIATALFAGVIQNPDVSQKIRHYTKGGDDAGKAEWIPLDDERLVDMRASHAEILVNTLRSGTCMPDKKSPTLLRQLNTVFSR